MEYVTPPGSDEVPKQSKKSSTPPPTSEDKARKAIEYAIQKSGVLDNYVLHKVIGFGSNGVVLAGECFLYERFENVAIKLIYKSNKLDSHSPVEISVLRKLAGSEHSGFLRYIDSLQDDHSFILVTELFGTDWSKLLCQTSKSLENNLKPQPLTPICCKNPRSGLQITLQFCSGCCDLWAWSFFERVQNWHSQQIFCKPLLPIKLIKSIIFQTIHSLMILHENLGLFHGDIKAENLLLAKAHDHGQIYECKVKICDFGHANLIANGVKRAGTFDSAAPELANIERTRLAVDGAKVDVYCVGMMLLKLLHSATGGSEGVATNSSFGEAIGEDLQYALSLARMMTDADPRKRVSMRLALAHKWFSP
ncbi:hypothetical protein HDU83_008021 [Entophlyctis luteolus]|nr:hypothetical protein HDU83_008021 [Entophlyctis luteolus]